MRHLDGLAAIAAGYDGFIVDLWGVVHDGVEPYPRAVECLRRLRETGNPVLLLSNAPRRSHAAAAGLAAMGIGPDLYSDLLTSGEAAWEALAEARGLRVLHIGPSRDLSIIEDRDIRLVGSPGDADLLLNTGPDDRRDPTRIEPFLPDLQASLRFRLPMLCANPDLEVLRGATRVICAGALAAWYEENGGSVRWIGKPYPEIYRLALRRIDRPAVALLAIGDSLRTDIAGAAAFGISACWALSGIHTNLGAESAQREAAEAGLAPAFTIDELRW